MNPICTTCNKEMKTIKNGVLIRASEDNPEWVANGDLAQCSNCETQVITGVGEFYSMTLENQAKFETPEGSYTLKS